MKKILFLLIFSTSLIAQKIEFIALQDNIKDKRGLIKSLTLMDSRPDKEIGQLAFKDSSVQIKFRSDDLKSYVENWFSEYNEEKGNSDIILMLEELKVYDEQDKDQKHAFGKVKIKISSFLKRNDRYYFINRFENVIVSDPKRTSNMPRYLAHTISEVLTAFIKSSFTTTVSGQYIPENEINNYDDYLTKYNIAYTASALKDGYIKILKAFHHKSPHSGIIQRKTERGML
ncbi:hypothetical protein [Chryseobacterium gossypii]|uniref:hypothetical protein n=1 Tax=Chryseobacterium gossypii TaxID=3231602 RepID=UPI00352418F3